MNPQLLLENYRTWLANTLHIDSSSVVDALNKNGFPTSYSTAQDKLIEVTLKAFMVSKAFQDQLNQLILKNNASEMQSILTPKKSNFAAQPEVMTILNTNNLVSGPQLVPPTSQTQIFEKAPLFVDNCKNC